MEQPQVLNSQQRQACAMIDTMQACADRLHALVIATYTVLDSDAHQHYAMTLASMAESEVFTLHHDLERLYETITGKADEPRASSYVKEATPNDAAIVGDDYEHQPW